MFYGDFLKVLKELSIYWPQILLKGPKRSLVVGIVMGVESSWKKDIPNGTKKTSQTKFVPNRTKNFRKGTANVLKWKFLEIG